jgi:hypothetical protein
LQPEGSARRELRQVQVAWDAEPAELPEARVEQPPAGAAWDVQALLRAEQEGPDGAAGELRPVAAGAEQQGVQQAERPEALQRAARQDAAPRPVADPLAQPSAEPWARLRARVQLAPCGTTRRRPSHTTRVP